MSNLSPIWNIILGAGSSVVVICIFLLKSSWKFVSDVATLKADVSNLKTGQEDVKRDIMQIRNEMFSTAIQKTRR